MFVRRQPQWRRLAAARSTKSYQSATVTEDIKLAASEQVSTDFLQLVRLGLRSPNDPLIQSSLKVVDHLLKADTPSGTVWRRYNEDGYGEHEDGSAYDGVGRGRPWPLLAGERGHYELVAGRDPLSFLRTMAAAASVGGMLREQVWDGPAIPSRRLQAGRPTESAMPLAWRTRSSLNSWYLAVSVIPSTGQELRGKGTKVRHQWSELSSGGRTPASGSLLLNRTLWLRCLDLVQFAGVSMGGRQSEKHQQKRRALDSMRPP